LYSQPAFQAGTLRYVTIGGVVKGTIVPTPGMPDTIHRHVPDVSLNAAYHTPYLIAFQGKPGGVIGTSAAAPSFAGLMALVEQKNGQWLGNANYNLYGLAIRQLTGVNAPPVFHDVQVGNNFEAFGEIIGRQAPPFPSTIGYCPIPIGQLGYCAGPGYDEATGLGSVDATQLVNGWPRSLTALW
jgi:subtilase family serine protease